MKRTVTLSLKFANKEKKEVLAKFLKEYRRVLIWYIDKLYGRNDLQRFPSQEITKNCTDSWLTARAKQCAAQQATAILRKNSKKHRQRIWRREQLAKDGKDTSKLDILIADPPKKPQIKNNVVAMISSLIVNISKSKNSFDLWIKFRCLGKQLSILIPLKSTKMFIKWSKYGKMSSTIFLSDNCIHVFFDIPEQKNNGKRLGVDIGQRNCLATNEGQLVTTCPHGHTLKSICEKLARRKKGSKNFKKAQQHRKNFIGWSIRQLNFKETGEIVIEKIINLRKGKRTTRVLSHFSYAEIFDRLKLTAEEYGVRVIEVNPAYTSQTCPACDDINPKNRRGTKFKCKACGYAGHADIVGATNVLSASL